MKEKTALITGGAAGIGKMTAELLAEKGFHIVINYRKSEEKARKLAEEIQRKHRVMAAAVKGDVASMEDCRRIYEQAISLTGRVDVLIHNAGPYIRERRKMADYSLDEWLYLVNGNLNAVFYLTKLCLPAMRENRWGRIITMGFDRAETAAGWPERSAFAAAKSAVASLTKTLSREEAEYGITVNMVSPGDIEGDWKEKRIGEAMGRPDPGTPVGRPGTGEDVARVISFLCGEESDFITGAVISVTGGKDVLGKGKGK